VFTGIVREVGRVVSVAGGQNGAALVVEAPASAAGVEVGGSVAVDGVCLTAEAVEGDTISFHAVPETLRRSSLGKLVPDARVNLEPALRAGEPLGGHFVQGHVDGVGRIRGIEPEGDSVRVAIDAPGELLRYCVEKGSITVAGVSLTVAGLGDDHLVVALIPHTLAVTTLGNLLPGREVNLEVDVIAKYVERLVGRD
jgi:riboflavin synthase